MGRSNDRDKGKKRAPMRDTNRRGKPKVCLFCREHIAWVDYKDAPLLRRFLSDRAKIKARRTTGTCVQHQRDVAVAIKTARELALLPYVQRTVSDRAGGREGRGGGGGGRGRPPAMAPAGLDSVADTAIGEGVIGEADSDLDLDTVPVTDAELEFETSDEDSAGEADENDKPAGELVSEGSAAE